MNVQVKVKAGVFNVRDLRAELIAFAYLAQEDLAACFLLALIDSRVSRHRLFEEVSLFESIIAPHIRGRIHVAQGDRFGHLEGIPSFIPRELVQRELENSRPVKSKRSAGVGQFNVQNILLLKWLNGLGPQTIKSIGEASGTSYPTTAAAINALEGQGMLLVEKDRSVSLRCFPTEQWRKWIAIGFTHRKSARFIDRSGQPRPPSSLIKRLKRLDRDDIAISGIEGAREHYPELDLTGALRLDLVLHGSHKSDLSFVQKLDPALQLADNPYKQADLVIHFLDRPATHFERCGDHLIADPLECLADLYDLKLDQQADQMLYFLTEQKKINGQPLLAG